MRVVCVTNFGPENSAQETPAVSFAPDVRIAVLGIYDEVMTG